MNEPIPNEPSLAANFHSSLRDMADTLNAAAEHGVQLQEIGEPDEQYSLAIQTGSGTINLTRQQGRIYTVDASEDPSMKADTTVALSGASVSGSGERPGLFAPNTRLTFQKQLPMHYLEFGDTDTNTTITRETYDRTVADGYGDAHKILEDGRVAVRTFNPTIRATDFVAHAQKLTEEGVTQLF